MNVIFDYMIVVYPKGFSSYTDYGHVCLTETPSDEEELYEKIYDQERKKRGDKCTIGVAAYQRRQPELVQFKGWIENQ